MKEDKTRKNDKKNYETIISFEDNKLTSNKFNSFYYNILIDYLLGKSHRSFFSNTIELFYPTKKRIKKKSIEEQKHILVKQLLASNINPVVFDVLLSNEINRRLKVKFGVTFLIFTLIITISSYAIVIFDGIYNWKISSIAITALIIETPIQFVGLLYIIARNLFPSANNEQSNINIPVTLHKNIDKIS